MPTPDDAQTIHVPNAVLLPGLVNTHTHLELTVLGGEIEDEGFYDWIQHIRRAKTHLSAEAFRESARRGVRDAWRCGITTVADTGDSEAVVDALTELAGRGVVYHEIFGPHPDQADVAMVELERAVGQLVQRAGEFVRVGVSPHAPYSVSGPLYRRVSQFAIREGFPVAVHIAESPAEVEFVVRREGPFAAAWHDRGIPSVETARSPVAYLHLLGVLDSKPLAIHAVHTDRADAELLAEYGCTVALCPVSNRRHGHGEPPVRRLMDAGVASGVGTDSVASVGALDLFREVRDARALGGLSAADAISLATLDGARALGLDEEVGSLEEGKWGDLCVLELSTAPAREASQLAEQIVEASPAQILHTYVAGRRVYNARPDP